MSMGVRGGELNLILEVTKNIPSECLDLRHECVSEIEGLGEIENAESREDKVCAVCISDNPN
jgi:hypothetical protein